MKSGKPQGGKKQWNLGNHKVKTVKFRKPMDRDKVYTRRQIAFTSLSKNTSSSTARVRTQKKKNVTEISHTLKGFESNCWVIKKLTTIIQCLATASTVKEINSFLTWHWISSLNTFFLFQAVTATRFHRLLTITKHTHTLHTTQTKNIQLFPETTFRIKPL